MAIRRGQVYWVDLEPTAGSQQSGRRPCLVLTVDSINDFRRTVGVVPLSTSPRVAEPIVIAIRSIGPQTVAICDQLRAVDKRKINRLVGAVSSEDLGQVERSVKAVFGLR